MPFKSESQRRLFWAKVDRGEISKSKALEWEHATKNKKLPEKVRHKSASLQIAYMAGSDAALKRLFGKTAAEDVTAHPPDDAPAAIPIGGGNPPYNEPSGLSEAQLMELLQPKDGAGRPQKSEGTSDDFVRFVQEDKTEQETDAGEGAPEAGNMPEKPVHWSGNNSLESGDVGTRSYSMGLPRFGGV